VASFLSLVALVGKVRRKGLKPFGIPLVFTYGRLAGLEPDIG